MLTHLSIKDFAVIDSVSLDFHQGFHIFTGETGAGKSILIEAISLALGSRADTAYVRSGKDKAVIELSFRTEDPRILSLLLENELVTGLSEQSVDITREIQAEGRNTCRINGTLVSVAFLSKVCKGLADIHGQYDHQSLLDPEQHLLLLDAYGSSEIKELAKAVATDYRDYAARKHELSHFLKQKDDTEKQRDFMAFQLKEIEEIAPRLYEDEELSESISVMQNSELIHNRLSEAYQILFDGTEFPSALDGMSRSLHLLEEAGAYSQDIRSFAAALNDCFYRIDDLRSDIRKAKESVSYQPEELDRMIKRLDSLENLKKKHGGTLEKVLTQREELREALTKIEDADGYTKKLSQELAVAQAKLTESSSALSHARKKVALLMEERITKELQELHFKDAALSVSFQEKEESDLIYSEKGMDSVEFLLVTNKGELPKPLVKVASGGEISRIMLAFKSVIGDYAGIPTMIFDEIDSGISGITASVVGKKLREISKKHQVLCITHLPQIAAFSDRHYRIEKATVGERTESQVKALDHMEKVSEIARLTGGLQITDTTLKNAEELIAEALK